MEYCLHKNFVDESEYSLILKGMESTINVKRILNESSRNTIFLNDLKTTGRLSQNPDYHGISEVYIIRQTIDSHKDIDKSRCKLLCIEFLNKLIDSVRLCTGKYWLDNVIESDLIYFRFLGDDERPTGFMIDDTDDLTTSFDLKEQNEVRNQINNLLLSDRNLDNYHLLIMESKNFILKSKYNIAIILSNTALEVYFEDYVKKIYHAKYPNNPLERDKKIRIVLEGKKLHKKVQRFIYENKSHKELLESDKHYQEFDYARNSRTNSVHRNNSQNIEAAQKTLEYIEGFVKFMEDKYCILLERI
jgi:hypothetical protein